MSILDDEEVQIAEGDKKMEAWCIWKEFYERRITPLIEKAGNSANFCDLVICVKNISNHQLFYLNEIPNIYIIDGENINYSSMGRIFEDIEHNNPKMVVINNCDAIPSGEQSDFFFRNITRRLNQRGVPVVLVTTKMEYDFSLLPAPYSNSQQINL